MLLQTNSYIVPPEKRAEHARLMRRFRQVLNKVGCDSFEVYEQVGANWSSGPTTGRFVQIMRFRDRKHQMAVQSAERTDPLAQQLIAEFCELINYPVQQDQRQFAVGFYTSAIPVAPLGVAAQGTEEEAAAAGTVPDAEGEPADFPEWPAAAAAEAQAADAPDPSDAAAHEDARAAADEPQPHPAETEHFAEQDAEAGDAAEDPAPETGATAETEIAAAPPHPAEAADIELLTADPHEEFQADEEALEAELRLEPGGSPVADEHAEPPPPDSPAEEAHEPAAEKIDRSPHPRFAEAALEDDLHLEDDDITRLAEELAAQDDDDESADPRGPGNGGHGRASGNGDRR